MQIAILEPKQVVWEGRAKQVHLPGLDGEICVLDFHQSFLIRLRKGLVRAGNQRYAIKDGLAFMRSNNLTIFVEI